MKDTIFFSAGRGMGIFGVVCLLAPVRRLHQLAARSLASASKTARAQGVRDGQYFIQYVGGRGCDDQYLTYTSGGRGNPAGVRIRGEPQPWSVSNRSNGRIVLTALNRSQNPLVKLSYSPSCSSKSVNVRSSRGVLSWRLNDASGGNNVFYIDALRRESCEKRGKYRGILGPNNVRKSNCRDKTLKLYNTGSKSAGSSKFKFILVENDDPTISPPPPPFPRPIPNPSQDSSPPPPPTAQPSPNPQPPTFNPDLPSYWWRTIAMNADGRTMVVQGEDGISGPSHAYVTRDGGSTWEELGGGFEPNVQTIWISSDGLTMLSAPRTGSYGIQVSRNGGRNWESIPYEGQNPDSPQRFNQFASGVLGGVVVYYAGGSDGVYQARSLTNGVGFVRSGSGFGNQPQNGVSIRGLCVSSNSEVQYAAEFGQKLLKSSDAGDTWSPLDSTPGNSQTERSWNGLACSADGSIVFPYLELIFASELKPNIYRSDDGGVLWNDVNLNRDFTPPSVSCDASCQTVIVASTSLFVSRDRGNSFQVKFGPGIPDFLPQFVPENVRAGAISGDASVIAVVTSPQQNRPGVGQVWISRDSGVTFTLSG